MKEIFAFLKELKKNNNREWFAANKERYLAVKDKVEILTARLIAELAKIDPDAARLTPRDCTYRIYRDTRFSPDKTPYKTHIGIFINPPGGKKSPRCGYYLHLEPGHSLVAGGAWCPEPRLLKEIRQAIYDNADEYLEVINDPAFAAAFTSVGEDPLKTAPKGFPKDWEHIALLKPRSFTAYSPIPDAVVKGPNLIGEAVKRMKLVKPFNDFLNYTIDEYTGGVS